MSKIAVVFGATGLVGGACLDLMLGDARFDRVHTIGRRAPPRQHAKLTAHCLELDRLADMKALPITRPEIVICCLGTTIAKAGSQAAFRRVDFDHVLVAGRYAEAMGASQFQLVSSVGADARSRFFYTRVKGETEAAIAALRIPSIGIFRPSLILGPRTESRMSETLAKNVMHWISPALRGPLGIFRPINAEHIAQAMLAAYDQQKPGIVVYDYTAMKALLAGDESR